MEANKITLEQYFAAKGLKAHLADYLGVSRTLVTMILKGDRSIKPYREKIVELINRSHEDNNAVAALHQVIFPGEDDFVNSAQGVSSFDKCYPYQYFKNKGWTDAKLAAATPYSRGTIQRVIQGRPCDLGSSDFFILRDIAKVMGVKVNDIPWADPAQVATAKFMDSVAEKYGHLSVEETMQMLKEQFPPEFICFQLSSQSEKYLFDNDKLFVIQN